MKNFLMTAAAVAALSISTLCAQSFDSVRVTFDKAVEVAGTSVPAGQYTISVMKSNGDVPLLRFQGEHGVNVVAFASREYRTGNEMAPRTNVVLDTEGATEQVSRIEIEGSTTDYVLPLAHHTN
jgi:hypothetical protein